jgi:hypothetical protein
MNSIISLLLLVVGIVHCLVPIAEGAVSQEGPERFLKHARPTDLKNRSVLMFAAPPPFLKHNRFENHPILNHGVHRDHGAKNTRVSTFAFPQIAL